MTWYKSRASAAAGLLVLLALGQAAAVTPSPAAGEPLVLAHPPINKSIGNPVYCLTFVNDGSLLATGAASGVLVWDVASGKLRHTLEVDGRGVDSLAVTPNGRLLVAGGASGIIKIWDTQTFREVRTLEPAAGAVRTLAISPDGARLAVAGPNGQLGIADKQFGILLWDLATGRELPTIPHPPPEFGTTVLSFLPNGKQLVAAQDRTLYVWDVETAKQIKTLDLPDLPRTLGSIALAGERLVTGAFEPKLRLWDTVTWKQLHAWDAHDRETPPRRGVSVVNFSPDGKYVLSGGMDGMACVWEAASGSRVLELDARGEASGRWITGVAMTPDAALLAAAHYGGTATIWRIVENK